MKFKKLFLFAVLALTVLPASAELTTDDVSSREYLMNHGHSSSAADVVELGKGAVNGDKVVLPIDHKYDNKPLVYRWFDKFFLYVDPGLDKGQFLREDTKFEPSINDIP